MNEWRLRGIRGAITIDENSPQAIHEAVRELLDSIQKENRFSLEDVAAVYFTSTPDLTATFPATAARGAGWDRVPLLCAVEVAVEGAPGRCIRVMILVNTNKTQAEISHVYLREARRLRPDLG